MTDELIDGLVAGAAAYDDTAVLAIDLHGAEQALLEEIMSTSTGWSWPRTRRKAARSPTPPRSSRKTRPRTGAITVKSPGL